MDFAFGTYGDIISGVEKVQEYLTYFYSAVGITKFLKEKYELQMYSYFNTYIRLRPNASSSSDKMFRAVVDPVFEGIKIMNNKIAR